MAHYSPRTKLQVMRAYVQGHEPNLARSARKYGVTESTAQSWAKRERWHEKRQQYAIEASKRLMQGELPPAPVHAPDPPDDLPHDPDLIALEVQLARVRGVLSRATDPARLVQWAKLEDLLLARKARLTAPAQSSGPVQVEESGPPVRARIVPVPEQTG